MLKGGEPLLRAGLRQAAIVSGDHAMHAHPLLLLEMRECEMAHLRVNSIDTTIKLEKRRLHEFVTCRPPVFRKLRRDIERNSLPRICFILAAPLQIMFMLHTPKGARSMNMICRGAARMKQMRG